eukprot:m.343565 g.343565  ORF g.343565 m.343565 type:complete len:403 (+) comp23011_c0_seq1:294-1502(+)
MATAPPTSKLDRARRLSQRIDTVRASVRGARSKEAAEHLEGFAKVGYSHVKGREANSASLSALGFEYFDERAGRQAQFLQGYLGYLTHRMQRWAASYPLSAAQRPGQYNPANDSEIKPGTKLKRFIRKGIPMSLRPHVWMSLSGAGKKMQAKPGFYEKLVEAGQSLHYMDQISLDLPRTFPDNIHFRPEGCERQKQLGRVLLAYAVFNPNIGYCQGMNYVAGMLLLVLNGNEEQTFWLFDGMIAMLPPNLYQEDMKSVQAECATFVDLVTNEYPHIANVLRERGALEILNVVAVKWMISCFVDTVPEETVLRVWDILFYEGWKTLYRIGLALLINAYRSGEIQTHDSSSILAFLANIGWSAFDCNELLNLAFEHIESGGAHSRKSLSRTRESFLRQATEDDG